MQEIESYSSEEGTEEGLQLSYLGESGTRRRSKDNDRPSKMLKLADRNQMLEPKVDGSKIRTKNLIESLTAAVKQVVPPEKLGHQRQSDWNQFENYILLSKFPELKEKRSIELFGSWTYGMWTPSSDIDCNIRTPEIIPNFFSRLKAAVMMEYHGSTVKILAKCRVPVCKISLPCTLRIDVTHECEQHDDDESRHNELVRDWASKWQDNKVVCTSMRVIKQWATENKIHDPSSGSLNSMGYLVMLLAQVGPEDQSSRSEDSLECLEKVLNLLIRFFCAYSTIGQKKEVIYAPHGAVKKESAELDIIRLTAGVDDREHRGFGSTLFIQDPFLKNINLGRFVDKYSIKILRNSFQRAHEILEEGSKNAFQILLRSGIS